MGIFEEILQNRILMTAMVSWFMAQLIKVILMLINEPKFDVKRFMASGGMPSSHSSFTVGLAVGVGQTIGYNTPLFAVAAGFSFIVMYDAANVRLEAGKQAALLNRIIDMMDHSIKLDKRLKELLGHTPLQVFAGAVLGAVVGLILN